MFQRGGVGGGGGGYEGIVDDTVLSETQVLPGDRLVTLTIMMLHAVAHVFFEVHL